MVQTVCTLYLNKVVRRCIWKCIAKKCVMYNGLCSCCELCLSFVFMYTAVSAAKDAVGQIDVNKAMEYKAKFDELTADDSNKKED